MKEKNKNIGNVLFNVYCEWRKIGEDGEVSFTWDCGEVSARKDFSDYAGLENGITFEEMLKLEERYKSQRFNRK